jgi:1-acyl-sn-glycerol-3-phosphate acyltransferase
VLRANHQSLIDTVVVLASSPRPLHFAVKRELAPVPVFGGGLAIEVRAYFACGNSG